MGRFRRDGRYIREDASWRKMLVCQPPVKRLVVKGGEGGEYVSKEGMRMGMTDDVLGGGFQKYCG